MKNLIIFGLLAIILSGCATTSDVGTVGLGKLGVGTGVHHDWNTGGEVWSYFSIYSIDKVQLSANGYCSKRGLGVANIKLISEPSGIYEYYKYKFECSQQAVKYNAAAAVHPVSSSEAKQVEEGFAIYNGGDYVAAFKTFQSPALQGNALAQLLLGVMYEKGQGTTQSFTEAFKWYQLSASQGNAVAQNNLGLMYMVGQGVNKNYAEANKWYQLSAAQGLAVAQNNLGVMYADGNGIPQNLAEAIKWYTLAANQGNAMAKQNLSRLSAATISNSQSYPTGGGYDPKAEQSYSTGGGYDPKAEVKSQQVTTYNPPPESKPQPVQTYAAPLSYQPRNEEESKCYSFGFTPNSDGFGNCMLQLSQAKQNQLAYEEAAKDRKRQLGLKQMECGLNMMAGRPCSGGSNAPAQSQPAPFSIMTPRGFIVCDHVGGGNYNCH